MDDVAMTTRAALLARIQAVVNRTRVHDRIAAEVMAEIEREYVLVEKDQSLYRHCERCGRGGDHWEAYVNAVGQQDRGPCPNCDGEGYVLFDPGDPDPIRHGAAESDTAEA